MLPPTMRPGGSATSRRIESALTDLPQPDFADDGDRLALTDIIADAVDRLDHAGRGEEVGLQIVYLEKLGHRVSLSLFLKML